MNGKALQNKEMAEDRREMSKSRAFIARMPQRFVRPVWAGPAGFGDNNCVDTEARLYLSEFSRNADNLACSFEEHSFPINLSLVSVKLLNR